MFVAEKNLRVWEAQLRMASEKVIFHDLIISYFAIDC